jgi:hypothetical protein
MLICVCLRILASSRIPQYDLGRQTPHFGGGSVTPTETYLPFQLLDFFYILSSIIFQSKLFSFL